MTIFCTTRAVTPNNKFSLHPELFIHSCQFNIKIIPCKYPYYDGESIVELGTLESRLEPAYNRFHLTEKNGPVSSMAV